MTRLLNFRCPRCLLLAAALLAPLADTAAGRTVAAVQEVRPARLADLVILDAGYSAGLRQGMICRIKRGPLDVAELVVVELRIGCCAALIMGLSPRAAIRAGDAVEIKVLKS